MRFPLKTLTFALVLMAGIAPAKADVFVWRDAETKLSLSYPDTWRQIHNQQPNDIFTVAAPGDGEYATCRIRVTEDKRFIIYPRQFADEIQRLNFSRSFWENYVGEFNGATINGVWDNAGFGDGYASFADVSFISSAGPKVQKRGVMFAANYNDQLFVGECSSETSVFVNWSDHFLSFVKSVDFKNEYALFINGWYRGFMSDDVLRIHGRRPVDLYTY
jgi:hypothetical protein